MITQTSTDRVVSTMLTTLKAENRPMRAADLISRLKLSVSGNTAVQILRTLVSVGLVRRWPSTNPMTPDTFSAAEVLG